MTTTSNLMTAEELWRLPADNLRHELVKGELRTMPPAGYEHGVIVIKLARLLANHVESNHLGVVLGAETGFLLRQNPDLVRAADVSFIAQSRIPKIAPKTYWQGAPDLAVEILSPSDTVEEIEEKTGDYLDAGCKLVWIINPNRKSVTVHRPGINPIVLYEFDSLDGADVVPGFVCKIDQLFV
jgi:Uma2 family endonuclease